MYGILSAATWGAADFIGGLASKRTSPYRVLFLAEIAGLIPFTALALLLREPVPPASDMLIGAGSSLIGFVLAFTAVWFISQTGSTDWRVSFADLRLPLFSGLFFGLYFLVIHRATLNAFFWPLAAARFSGLVIFGLYALITRQPAMPPRDIWGLSLINGVIDIGGNAFYVLAAQTGRIDVAAVLGSLYPASTVVLAWIILKERLTWLQIFGVLLAFIAIVLFTF